MKNINEEIVKLYTELDSQDGRIKMIALGLGYNSTPKERKKSKELLEYLVRAKYESNLKMIEYIINTKEEDD